MTAGALVLGRSGISSFDIDFTRTALDTAVFAAYGWPVGLSDDELLAKLLALNLSRAGTAAVVAAGDEDEE